MCALFIAPLRGAGNNLCYNAAFIEESGEGKKSLCVCIKKGALKKELWGLNCAGENRHAQTSKPEKRIFQKPEGLRTMTMSLDHRLSNIEALGCWLGLSQRWYLTT